MHVRSFLPAAIGAAIAILAVVAPAARVGATNASACTAQSGVTVIVDFTHFGRGIEQGCAPGDPTTALAALHTAGFTTAGTAQYGDAFVCRIDDLPSPKSQACASTPPAKASWAFYFAHSTDSDWTYSTAGVLSNDPAPGSIIAFAFGDYAKPGVRPSAASVTPPTTATTAVAPTVPPTTPPVSAQTVTPPTVNVGGPPVTAFLTGPAGPTTSTPSPPSTAATGTPTSSPSGASATLKFVSGPAATARSSPGSVLPAVIAVVLVAMLSAGAVVTMRARRRRAA